MTWEEVTVIGIVLVCVSYVIVKVKPSFRFEW